ncbi:MAG: alginate lyase family protein [Candidatus Sumerlaeaceae bacterium]
MNRLVWYYRRLQAMPPAEIADRVRHKLEQQWLARFGPPRKFLDFELSDPIGLGFRLVAPVPELVEEARSHFSPIADRAKSSDRNSFALLGLPERHFGSPLNWFLDPVTGKCWPSDECAFSIDYRHQSDLGEVKYVWELGRMPWLVPRALAARMLDDEDVARTVVEDILHFVRCNPPYRGIHWTSGLELALRVVNWTWALALIEPFAVVGRAEAGTIAAYVALAADFCRRFLSRYSSSNNHLIGEAACLEVAGVAWPFLPDSRLHAQLGARLLDAEFPRQVTPDGFCVELSVGYLLEDVAWSLCVAAARRQSGREIPEAWRQRWRAVAKFLSTIHSDGCPFPALADSDDAEIIPLGVQIQPEQWPVLLRCMAGECGEKRSQSLPFSVRLAKWLWGANAPRDTGHEERTGSPNARIAPEHAEPAAASLFQPSGILVLRGKDTKLIADVGLHGYPPLYAHAHADALSLLIDARGEQILVDSGTFCYHGQRAWRDWFRSTRAHNTLEINGRDQSEMCGPFLWRRVASTRIEEWTFGAWAECSASHDGYVLWRHRRTIRTEFDDRYVVMDAVCAEKQGAKAPETITMWWHFADGEVSVQEGRAEWHGKCYDCALEWEPSGEATCYVGDEVVPQGWISPHFSIRLAAPALGIRFCPRSLPFACRTIIAIKRHPGRRRG